MCGKANTCKHGSDFHYTASEITRKAVQRLESNYNAWVLINKTRWCCVASKNEALCKLYRTIIRLSFVAMLRSESSKLSCN